MSLRKGKMWTRTCTQRAGCEDEGGGRGDASTGPGASDTASEPQELGGGGAASKELPCPHLTSDFGLQVCGTWLWQPWDIAVFAKSPLRATWCFGKPELS